MDDFMKIVKSLEDAGLLIKGISGTIKNEAKDQKGGFFSMSLSTLGASLLGNLLTGKGVKQSNTLDRVATISNRTPANIAGRGVMRAAERAIATSQGQGTFRAGQDF